VTAASGAAVPGARASAVAKARVRLGGVAPARARRRALIGAAVGRGRIPFARRPARAGE